MLSSKLQICSLIPLKFSQNKDVKPLCLYGNKKRVSVDFKSLFGMKKGLRFLGYNQKESLFLWEGSPQTKRNYLKEVAMYIKNEAYKIKN